MTASLGSTRLAGCDRTVVLVHGMLSGRRSMRKIATSLASAGFGVINWGYPTLTQSLQVHGRNLSAVIRRQFDRVGTSRLHFVGHSMGCIIVRLAIEQTPVARGSRLVLLAPPNSGSRLTRLPTGPLTRFLPQIAELSEASDSFVNQLPEPRGVDVGILAAERDRVVDLTSTYLRNQNDHLVLPTTHQKLPLANQAIDQVLNFIQHGRFRHTVAARPIGRVHARSA